MYGVRTEFARFAVPSAPRDQRLEGSLPDGRRNLPAAVESRLVIAAKPLGAEVGTIDGLELFRGDFEEGHISTTR